MKINEYVYMYIYIYIHIITTLFGRCKQGVRTQNVTFCFDLSGRKSKDPTGKAICM